MCTLLLQKPMVFQLGLALLLVKPIVFQLGCPGLGRAGHDRTGPFSNKTNGFSRFCSSTNGAVPSRPLGSQPAMLTLKPGWAGPAPETCHTWLFCLQEQWIFNIFASPAGQSTSRFLICAGICAVYIASRTLSGELLSKPLIRSFNRPPYIYIYIYTYMCVYIYIDIYVHIHIHTHIHTHIYMYTYRCMYTCAYVCVYIRV